MMEKIAKNVKFWLIWKMIRNQSLHQKSLILEEKESFFKQILHMVRSTLLHLHLSAGLRLVLGLPALVRDFDPLTLNLW